MAGHASPLFACMARVQVPQAALPQRLPAPASAGLAAPATVGR
ncbi:hypothetical protein DLM_2955 [Aquitalea magnusonii]|uniref:Uncharacterized protein n=1 Tax=Aquitalea magnusonii TaxID=332411 RepID=A0A3G9GN20_9NEIS|nr:hypothetical protein DLM_2955 [Aquitalea magnusonii]